MTPSMVAMTIIFGILLLGAITCIFWNAAADEPGAVDGSGPGLWLDFRLAPNGGGDLHHFRFSWG